jgi:hypothetical protein
VHTEDWNNPEKQKSAFPAAIGQDFYKTAQCFQLLLLRLWLSYYRAGVFKNSAMFPVAAPLAKQL